MKNVLKNTIRKKINLSKKKLIEQPLKILKKVNIEKLTKFASSSLKEKYNKFKERAKQKELHKIKLIKEYFFVEGNKVRCEDHGGYEPTTSDECAEASRTLGLEWKKGPRKNGWNNSDCSSNYSKCIWRKETSENSNNVCKTKEADKGLLYNENCSGMENYETNGIDNIYKTVCISPIKAFKNDN